MDEILTDAELQEAERCIDGWIAWAHEARRPVPHAILMLHLALQELKLRREETRTTTCSSGPCSPGAADAGGRIL